MTDINGTGRARERARERRRRERRFVRRTALISAAALCLLLAALALLAPLLPAYYRGRADRALAAGDTARAALLAERLPEEQRQAVLKDCAYYDAAALYESGSYAAAAEAFLALGGHRDAPDRAKACQYQQALRLMEAGSFEEARALLGTLLAYADALYRYDLCGYRLAEAAYEAGDAADAIALFLALGDFEDAHARAGSIAAAVTGIADPEAALLAASGLDDEAFLRRAALTEARQSLPSGLVAAGFYHTLARRGDGTVLAAGDNSRGQCDVGAWSKVAAVAAGAYHSLALLSDGSVLAVGDNRYGQCDVGAWRDVVAIAAGDYNSYALLSDGTVRSCGFVPCPSVDGWRDAVAIAAGAHAFGAVRRSGTLLAVHPSNADESMQNLVACAVSTGYTLGLTVDGHVRGNAFTPEDWDDVVAISASPTAALGLTVDGRVLAHSIRGADVSAMTQLSGVAGLAAGGTHCAFALLDGSVHALGDNRYGQCDTAGWDLDN